MCLQVCAVCRRRQGPAREPGAGPGQVRALAGRMRGQTVPCLRHDFDPPFFARLAFFARSPRWLAFARCPDHEDVVDRVTPTILVNDFDIIWTRFSSLASANATITVPHRGVYATLLGISR